MHIEMKTPASLEGDWTLLDAEGKTIASSKEQQGAVLIIEPYFYKRMYSQVLLRIAVKGKKGRMAHTALRITAKTGKLTAEAATAAPTKVIPKFDTLTKDSRED